MDKPMRGIYAIPPTPFNDDFTVDEGGVDSIADFCVAAGSHGIVSPVNASEFTSLSDDERKRIVELTAKRVNGRIPYVAGVSGVSAQVAKMFAEHAKASGADAVIAMPPYVIKCGEDEIMKYFDAISNACGLPIFIQNYLAPVGTPLSAKFMMRLIKEIPNVDYIKEETQYASHVISECVELSEKLPAGKFKGVMGGKAGRYVIDEFNRGAVGNMPACEVADVASEIWDALEQGRAAEAVDMYHKLIPLLNMEYQYGSILYKMVLKYRGVIKSELTRQNSSNRLDGADMVEFYRIMDYIKPMFRI